MSNEHTKDSKEKKVRGTEKEKLRASQGVQGGIPDGFDLTEAVLKFEAKFITKALKQTGGKVTAAAELLGISHQNLSLMLKKRHRELESHKKPRRKRSDRKRPKPRRNKKPAKKKG